MTLDKNGRKHSVTSLLSFLPKLQHIFRVLPLEDFIHPLSSSKEQETLWVGSAGEQYRQIKIVRRLTFGNSRNCSLNWKQ